MLTYTPLKKSAGECSNCHNTEGLYIKTSAGSYVCIYCEQEVKLMTPPASSPVYGESNGLKFQHALLDRFIPPIGGSSIRTPGGPALGRPPFNGTSTASPRIPAGTKLGPAPQRAVHPDWLAPPSWDIPIQDYQYRVPDNIKMVDDPRLRQYEAPTEHLYELWATSNPRLREFFLGWDNEEGTWLLAGHHPSGDGCGRVIKVLFGQQDDIYDIKELIHSQVIRTKERGKELGYTVTNEIKLPYPGIDKDREGVIIHPA